MSDATETDTGVKLECCQTILGAPSGYARIYNSCSSCKTVTVDHTDGNVERVNIPGDSYADVQIRSGTIRLLGERNC